MVVGALAAIRNERSGRICAHAFDSGKTVNILPFFSAEALGSVIVRRYTPICIDPALSWAFFVIGWCWRKR